MDPIPTCVTQSSICTGGRHNQIPFHPSIQITRSDIWSASYCPLHPRGTRPAIPRDKSNITLALSSHIKQNDTKMFQRKSLIIRNMKVLSVIALGVFALGVVTFKSVASLPKLKSAAGTPFDWQQFLPGGKIFNFSVSFFFFFSLFFFKEGIKIWGEWSLTSSNPSKHTYEDNEGTPNKIKYQLDWHSTRIVVLKNHNPKPKPYLSFWNFSNDQPLISTVLETVSRPDTGDRHSLQNAGGELHIKRHGIWSDWKTHIFLTKRTRATSWFKVQPSYLWYPSSGNIVPNVIPPLLRTTSDLRQTMGGIMCVFFLAPLRHRTGAARP